MEIQKPAGAAAGNPYSLSAKQLPKIIMLLFFLCLYFPVKGEGSAQLNNTNDSARFFTYGYGTSRLDTPGQETQATITIFENPQTGMTPYSDYRYMYVYAKPGETIYLGTQYNANDVDIRVVYPNGIEKTYDVTTSSPGYIGTYLQERNGPNAICKTSDCSNYYNPVTINVIEEGLYKVAFYSTAATYGDAERSAAIKINMQKAAPVQERLFA